MSITNLERSMELKFSETVYDEINKVIGGSDKTNKQLLTLLLPGIALSKEDFEYNYKEHEEKGSTVEANESRLVNKLYDKITLNNADNGQMLPHQYKSALDVLTPKLNVEIAKSKNALRDLLLTKYPYKFKDEKGNVISADNTFQEVFFALYNDYVKALKEWTVLQNNKRAEIYNQAYYNEINRLTSANDEKGIKKLNIKKNDEYLRWFETEAYARFTELNQTMATLLSVFSENDMKILEGILDSGSGAELQEARETLRNLRKLTPDGAYIYPVKLNPTNWFEYLDNKFTYVDLLDDPNILRAKLEEVGRKKIATAARYEIIAKAIPNDETLKTAKANLESARTNCDKAFNELRDQGAGTFGDLVSETTKLVIGIYTDPNLVGSSKEEIDTKVAEKKDGMDKSTDDLVKNSLTKSAEKEIADNPSGGLAKEFEAKKKDKSAKVSSIGDLVDNFVGKLKESGAAVSHKLGEMNVALKNYAEALDANSILKNKTELKNAAHDLKTDLDLIDNEMQNIKGRLDVSEKLIGKEDLNVANPPDGFMTVYINHSMKDVKDTDYSETHVRHKTTEGGFLCFKSRSSKTTTDSYSWKLFTDKESTMEIGMNVAKVGIEREWFNPGLFLLSNNMYNLTNTPYTSLLPCYPTALLIGRDITIKQTIKNVRQFNFIHNAVTEIQNSDSYVFYHKGSSSKDSSTYSYYSDEEEAWIIITKIGTPQVIGFYLEDLPADKSAYYNDTDEPDNIRKFIEAYMKVINDRKNGVK